MVEAQTIRVQITKGDATFTEVDVEVYPWHAASFGDDPWEAWLHHVAPEWIDRTASGVHEERFRAVATDAASSAKLADIEFTHTTPKAVTVTVENRAADQLSDGLDELFRRLGPPATGK